MLADPADGSVTALLRVSRMWVAAVIIAVAPCAAGAQSTPTVTQLQPLSFGVMIPGTPEVVATTDGWRRATVQLAGSGQWSVRFVLPTALVSASGQTIPLTFSTTSGAYTTSKSSTPTVFDPNTGTKINLTAGKGSAWVYLGGTATPAAMQTAGNYSATVVTVVSPPNM